MNGKQLRNSILQWAISGRLVPQCPNDEPAIELLKRINPKAAPITEDVPFTLPDSWCWTTLGEISNYGSCDNVDVYSINPNDWVLELEDIEKDSAKVIKTISKSERDIKGVRHKFHKGQILYSKLRTYLNKALVVQCDGFCTTEIMPLDVKDRISPYYICHVLRSQYFLDYTNMCGYGVKMPRLSTKDAQKGLIPLPPLAEQERIVRKVEELLPLVERYDKAQTELDRLNASLKGKLRASVLQEAIAGRLVPQDPNDEPAIELLKRINPKFTPQQTDEPLPQGWTATTMSMLCELTDGEKTKGKEMINLDAKYLRGQNEGNTLKEGRQIPANSLLILVDGENSGEVFRAPIEGYQGSTFKRLVINDNMYEPFVLQVINSHRTKLRKNKVGAAIPHLDKKLFKDLIVLVPPLAEQERIVGKVEELFAVLDALQ